MMSLVDCRRFYAEEIELAAGLSSSELVEAFAHVPREDFLGPGPWQVATASRGGLSAGGKIHLSYRTVHHPQQTYHNVLIALDAKSDINNGQPGSLASWIDALDLKAGDQAYHLGCGTGYYTAVLATVVGPQGTVMASEVHPDLAARARRNLSGYANVTVHAGDGSTFDPEECDAILINAGVGQPNPLWLDRLREGGRLVLPLTVSTGPTVGQGFMVKIVRAQSRFSAQVISPVAIFSCTGLRDAQSDESLRKAFTTGAFLKLHSVRRDSHEECDTCLLHRSGLCLSLTDADQTTR